MNDQQTTACGWGADCCGRDPRGCYQPGEEMPAPFSESEKATLRALALRLDLKAAARLLREHGYTVTEPANV